MPDFNLIFPLIPGDEPALRPAPMSKEFRLPIPNGPLGPEEWVPLHETVRFA